MVSLVPLFVFRGFFQRVIDRCRAMIFFPGMMDYFKVKGQAVASALAINDILHR